MTLLVFAPFVMTFVLTPRGYPALPSIVAGVVVRMFTQLFIQGPISVDAFVGVWNVAFADAAPSTGIRTVSSLPASDGLLGPAWAITVIPASPSLGGILERADCITILAHHLRWVLISTAPLTIKTTASSPMMNAITANQHMSIAIPGMSFHDLYDDLDLEGRNLSRAIKSVGTIMGTFIPWETGGAYMAGVLDVPTLQHASYYLLGFLSPFILVTIGLSK